MTMFVNIKFKLELNFCIYFFMKLMSNIFILITIIYACRNFCPYLIHLRTQWIISNTQYWSIHTTFLIYLGIIGMFRPIHNVFSVFMILLPIILTKWIDILLKRMKYVTFEDNFCHFLEKIILKMRSGYCFSEAITQSTRVSDLFSQKKLQFIKDKILNPSIDGTKQHDSYIEKCIDDMVQIKKNPQYAIKRLESLKNILKKNRNFRHKSGQLRTPIYFQLICLSVLYFAVLIFVINQFEYENVKYFLFPSLALFTVSWLWIYKIGRHISWKL